jgi:hypothetical protein
MILQTMRVIGSASRIPHGRDHGEDARRVLDIAERTNHVRKLTDEDMHWLFHARNSYRAFRDV